MLGGERSCRLGSGNVYTLSYPKVRAHRPGGTAMSKRAASACVGRFGPQSPPGSQGSLIHHRPHRLASQAACPVLSADDRHPHGVIVVIARGLVRPSSPCKLLQTALQTASHRNHSRIGRCACYCKLYEAAGTSASAVWHIVGREVGARPTMCLEGSRNGRLLAPVL